jgi:glycosyltransferase involved in cell wall biosynthesis
MTALQERVAIITSTLGGGGAQRSMIRLAGGLAERGRSVDLVLRHAAGHYATEVDPAVRVIDLHARRMAFALPALVRYFRRERPRAVLAALNYVNVIGLIARRIAGVRTRFVVSERNTLSVARGSSARDMLLPWLVRRFYPLADGIVAVSEGVADDLAEVTGLPRDQIQVIVNPVLTARAKEMAGEQLDHPWFTPGEPPVVISVGRLNEQKDLGTLIEAFDRIYEPRNARLLILGEGPERTRLEELIVARGLEGAVALPGWTANPYPFLRASKVFVLSSRWEGLPGALIEALYCGVPVIATDCPSGPREILGMGRHGRLVPVGDADLLGRAIADGLAGAIPRPTLESWQPYQQEVVVDRYLDVLLGG